MRRNQSTAMIAAALFALLLSLAAATCRALPGPPVAKITSAEVSSGAP